MTESIVFKDVSKIYAKGLEPAVHSLNLKIFQEEFFCLVGPSGCGKSTILKMVAGIEKPTAGLVTGPENVAMVFQSGALLPWLTVSENVGFGLKMLGVTPEQIRKMTLEYLQTVGLVGFDDKYPRALSGGQRQRVGIARALSMKPSVLLLDEPFSALDELITEELHKDLIRIWQKTKVTILMVSHLLEEAVLLADRVGVMRQGKIQEVVEIKLARPRNNGSEDFKKLLGKIKQLLSQ